MNDALFYITTLGCKVNQYESHALREAWLAAGLQEAPTADTAHIVVVNSCAVTAKAVADVRNTIRRVNRANPNASVLVTGCAAQVGAKELQQLAGVVATIGQAHKDILLGLFDDADSINVLATLAQKIAQRIEQQPSSFQPASPLLEALAQPNSQSLAFATNNDAVDSLAVESISKTVEYPQFSVNSYDRSRAVLKVQDGCSHRCTFCIVPLTRGRARSRALDNSVAEAKRLLDAGFREVVISGVNLRQYGRDLQPKHDFWDLVQELEKNLAPQWQGVMRFRMSSLEPGQLTQKALDTLAESKLIAPQLHLSLQSASPSVLARMGRGHYTPSTVNSFLHNLRSIWPVFGLGADILTAFPGETAEEHAETVAFCKAVPFTYAHVFPYSQRPDTPAAIMPGQLEAAVKKARAKELRDIINGKKKLFLQYLLQLPYLLVAPELTQHEVTTVAKGAEGAQGKDGITVVSGMPAKRYAFAGLSEYYADCFFANNTPTPATFELLKAKPVRIVDGGIEVEQL